MRSKKPIKTWYLPDNVACQNLFKQSIGNDNPACLDAFMQATFLLLRNGREFTINDCLNLMRYIDPAPTEVTKLFKAWSSKLVSLGRLKCIPSSQSVYDQDTFLVL